MKYLLIVLGVLIMVPGVGLAATNQCSCPCQENTNTNTPPPVVYSSAIRINEIFPNPEGDDAVGEFIELYNDSDMAVDLAGWQIADSSRAFTLSGMIGGHEYFVIPRSASQIALNNSGDEMVILRSPDGDEHDSITYTGSSEGESYSFVGDSWQWTTPTSGSENVVPTPPVDEPTTDQPAEDDTAAEEPTDEPPAEETPPSENEAAPIHVTFSEAFPNPIGDDAVGEFIELYNAGSTPADLTGWQLGDASTTRYTLSQTIPAGVYVAIMRSESKISLNNTDDSLKLYDPSGALVEQVDYTGNKESLSYARVNDAWGWTDSVTPNAANQPMSAAAAAAAEKGMTAKKPASRTSDEPVVLTVAAAKQAESRQLVRVTGTVVVAPDVFSPTFFYLMDDTGGVQIVSTKRQFPEGLTIGSHVTVTGKVGWTSGEAKITAATEDDVQLVGTDDLTSRESTIGDLGLGDEGTLITVSGIVSGRRGTRITLRDDNDDELPVIFKKKIQRDPASLTIGQGVSVTGVLVFRNDEWQLWPRTDDDITLEQALSSSAATLAVPPNTDAHEIRWGLYVLGGAMLLVVGVSLIRLRLRRPASLSLQRGEQHDHDDHAILEAWPTSPKSDSSS